MYSQKEMYNLNGFMSFKGTVFIVKTFLCQMNWWITDKQNKLYPYLVIIVSNGNEWNTDKRYSINKVSEIFCWMKEVRYKSLHIIYFHLYKMFRKANLQSLKVDWCVPSTWSGDGECLQLGQGFPEDDATALWLDVVRLCKSVNLLKII